MRDFYDVVAAVLRRGLVAGPIGASDMAAGEEIVQQPRPRRLPDDLRKAAVPQGYIPEYGQVRVLYKSAGLKDYTGREIVVAGYASPQVVDRERHVILKEAMARDLPRFLAEPKYANAMIMHSNVQVGEVLAEWTHPETGQVYRTEVDDIGLFVVIRIRTDPHRPKIVDKVIDDILAGKLKAFSISGDAPVESRQYVCADGTCFWVIPEIEFYEITICEEPVNQDARLVVLNKACDGACGLEKQESEQALAQDRLGSEEAVRERVEEIAEQVGESEAVRMLEDVIETEEKLKKVGAAGSGDQGTMQDFARPYTSKADDGEVEALARRYAAHLRAGASPEDSYFQLLQDAPSWFGTRADAFRRWLLRVYQMGLPIPAVRLRVAGRAEGEMIPDPVFTAWDLLQTALGAGSGGPKMPVAKDVSAVPHHHVTPEDGVPAPKVPDVPVAGGGWREQNEPDESERYYLNLALAALRPRRSFSVLPRPRQLDDFPVVRENVARAVPRSPRPLRGPGGAGESAGGRGQWAGGVGGRAQVGQRAGKREGRIPDRLGFARAALAAVEKDFPGGWRARDYLLDPKQQHDLPSERGSHAVQSGGSRVGKQQAATDIYTTEDVAPMSGRKVTEPLDTVLTPPPGVTGRRPESLVVHRDPHPRRGEQPPGYRGGVQTTNEGVSLSPLADLDSRGAYRS